VTSAAAPRAGRSAGAGSQAAGLPSGEAKRTAVREMFDAIAPRYDLVNKVMTFGLDVAWRRRTVGLLALPAPATVLDVACGTGDFVRLLQRLGHRPVGIDFSAGMLAHARVGEAPLLRSDAAAMPVRSGSVDGVVSGFALRNFADLGAVFSEVARVVRPGGRIALLDVGEPDRPLVRAGYRVWFRGAVPRIGRLLSDGSAYRYLPESVAYLPPPPELLAMLSAAGFSEGRRHALSGGAVQVITGTRA
jgi:demethylmenaquinone methyltransferase/2-methoxy-6-polyprenyl-1,4-benzoquinol methylase